MIRAGVVDDEDFVIRRHSGEDRLREVDCTLDVLFFIEHWINNRDAWPPGCHARCFNSGLKADDKLFGR